MTRDKAVGAASDEIRGETRSVHGDSNCEEDGGVGLVGRMTQDELREGRSKYASDGIVHVVTG